VYAKNGYKLTSAVENIFPIILVHNSITTGPGWKVGHRKLVSIVCW